MFKISQPTFTFSLTIFLFPFDPPPLLLSPLLQGSWFHSDNHHQRCNHQRQCNPSNKHYTSSTRRKLASNNPMLALKIPMKPHKQHHDTNAQERSTERFPNLSKVQVWIASLAGGGSGVEAEELCYGYTDGGECEGCAEPGEECTFCNTPLSAFHDFLCKRMIMRSGGRVKDSPRAK